MSQNLGNIKIILSNALYNQDDKSDLIKENNFYSFINKKRKRHFHNKNYKISKCPSCASSSLRKLYKHIHEIKDYSNNYNIIELEKSKNRQLTNELNNQLSNQNVSNSPKVKLFPKNFINNSDEKNNLSNNNTSPKKDSRKRENNVEDNKNNNSIINEDEKKNENKIIKNEEDKKDNNDVRKVLNNEKKKIVNLKISTTIIKTDNNINDKNGNNILSVYKNKKKENEQLYENDSLSENEIYSNSRQNIIETRLIRTSEKKKKVVKPKKRKEIILKVEKLIAPQI